MLLEKISPEVFFFLFFFPVDSKIQHVIYTQTSVFISPRQSVSVNLAYVWDVWRMIGSNT